MRSTVQRGRVDRERPSRQARSGGQVVARASELPILHAADDDARATLTLGPRATRPPPCVRRGAARRRRQGRARRRSLPLVHLLILPPGPGPAAGNQPALRFSPALTRRVYPAHVALGGRRP